MVIQLTAPNALCGRVIGRGGTKINGITVCLTFVILFYMKSFITTTILKVFNNCLIAKIFP